jgi:predicted DNA-binding antitoxin AbrB/MazE fold protein
MSQRIDAIFVNGVFQPQVPVDFANGQRVSLEVEASASLNDDLSDLRDLLDNQFIASCREHSEPAPSLEHVRQVLGTFQGSLSDLISEERDER